jgi:hypothetical protein
MFLVTAALSMTVYKITNPKLNPEREMLKAQKKRFKEYKDSEATIEEMKNSVSLGGK